MIYLFTGEDSQKKIASYENLLSTLKGEEVFHITRKEWDPMQIESFYSGAGLFYGRSAIVLSGILEKEDARSFVLERLSLLAKSNNLFIFLEGKLGKPIIDEFKKARAQIEVFERPKEYKEKFNSFALADALGSQSKFQLWLLFREAMKNGVALEELSGILFWKVKTMLTKRSYGKFKEKDLKNLAGKIATLLPEIRRRGQEPEMAFERFLLESF